MAKEQEEKYFFNDFKDNRKSLDLTVIVKSTKIQNNTSLLLKKVSLVNYPLYIQVIF